MQRYHNLYIQLNENKPNISSLTESLNMRIRYCGQFGLFKHAISESLGGYGDNFSDLCKAHEMLGFYVRDNGLTLSIAAHVWGLVFPLIMFGSDKLKLMYLNDAINGRLIGGHGITEKESGSNFNVATACAQKVSNGYLLNGSKIYVTNAPIADVLIIYAKFKSTISAFLVNTREPNISITEIANYAGFTTSSMGEVMLKDYFVHDDHVLGKLGKGAWMIQSALELERAFIFGGIIGSINHALKDLVAYLSNRQINDTPLITKQSIMYKISEMHCDLETMRLWIYECARLKDAGDPISLASSHAKLFISERLLKFSTEAVHLLGAEGLNKSRIFSDLVHDALASKILSGTTEIQKNLIFSYMKRAST